MKNILTALFISVVFFTNVNAEDFSKGVTVRPNPGERVTLGVFCKVSGSAVTAYEGLCNVLRSGRVTTIDAGRNKYRIERDPFTDSTGDLYESGIFVNSVKARGSCWVGDVVRYCAM